MRSSRTAARGVTLIELAVILAIVGILSVVAFDGFSRSKPRSDFNGFSAQLQSEIHAARQEALAAGGEVLVLVFPKYAHDRATGRIIVVKNSLDPAQSLLDKSATLNLLNYAPANPMAPGPNDSDLRGKVLEVLDFPEGILVGPDETGLDPLKFPYDNIELGKGCGFCGEDGSVGAIVFDGRGRTRFMTKSGTEIVTADKTTAGASLTIYHSGLGHGSRNSTSTIVVTSPQGLMRTLLND